MELTNEAIYRLFLEDLDALRRFEAERASRGLMRVPADDPDVDRLLESIAFFSARTRAAAAGATHAAVARMAAGTLDYLLDPMPAAALIRAQGADRSDALELKRGSLLRLQYPVGDQTAPAMVSMDSARSKVGFMSALCSTTLWPISVEAARLRQLRGRLAAEIQLSATVPQRGPRELSFYVRRLGDYRSSLALQVALQQSLGGATAGATAESPEVVCQVEFGQGSAPQPSAEADGRNPLARVRSFFHFPEQGLFVRVKVPALARPWTKLVIHLELTSAWPEDQPLSGDNLALFVVPTLNVWGDLAAPLVYDGTRDLYPIHGRTALDALEPLAVRGVYRADAGMAPLLPLGIGPSREGWELVRPFDGTTPQLRVRIPGALIKPAKLSVDALWSQPSLWAQVGGQPAVSLQLQRLQGVTYGLVGAVRRPRPSPIATDPARGLDLLALRAHRYLERDALVAMMDLLGASGDSAYAGCPGLIDTVSSREVSQGGELVRAYQISLSQPSTDVAPLLTRFGERIRDVIEAWSEDQVQVDVITHPSATRRPMVLP